MYKTFLYRFLMIIAFVFCWQNLAVAVISPVTQLQSVADRMIANLKTNKSRLSNFNVIRGIVNKVLLPTVDLNRMTSSVLGRYGSSATSLQREQFKKEFSYLVTTTYASALSSYDDDHVQFYPLRENFQNKQMMNVRSVIIRKNGQRIPIYYDVIRSGNAWKVYDFSIENVSMVQSYRSQFSNELASKGITGLLQRLKRHNRSK